MELLSFALAGNYKRFYRNLKEISKTTKKSPLIMFMDAALCSLFLGAGLSDYLNYKFYEKTWKERNTYITIGRCSSFYEKFSPKEHARNFSYKNNFHRIYHQYTKRDFYSIEDGMIKLDRFLKKHESFVIKPIDGLGGSKVSVMYAKDVKDQEEFHQKLDDETMFLEEFIIQDEAWGKISPNSVNTIRVMTSCIDGKAEVFFAAARLGSGKSIVDNFHQGGFGAIVDRERKVLIGPGVSKDMLEVDTHPASGILFDGYPVPYWDEIEKMTCEAALLNPKIKVVGWDVAISKNGPLIVEANRRPGFDLVQVALKKGTRYMFDNIRNMDKVAKKKMKEQKRLEK